MAGDSVTLYCEWCTADRGQKAPGVVPLGRWAVVFRDCPGCLLREDVDVEDIASGPSVGHVLVPNILCSHHFSELVAQQLPDSCQECGYVRGDFTEIIEQVIPLDPFAVARSTLDPSDAAIEESPTRRLTVLDGEDDTFPTDEQGW